jgi:hypothetical protein
LLPDEEHTHRLGPLLGAGVRFVDANGEPHRELRWLRGLGDALLGYPQMLHASFAPAPQPIDRSWFEALLLLATGVERAHRDADTHWLIEHAADLSLTVERGSAVAHDQPPGFVCDRTSRSFELLYLPFEPLGASHRAVDVWAMPTAPATGSLTIEWLDEVATYELAETGASLVLKSSDWRDSIYLDLDRLARHDALANGVAIVDGLPVGTYTVAPARRSAGSNWEYDRSVSVSGANSVTITENGCASLLLERSSYANESRGFQFDLEPGEIEVATWLEFVR